MLMKHYKLNASIRLGFDTDRKVESDKLQRLLSGFHVSGFLTRFCVLSPMPQANGIVGPDHQELLTPVAAGIPSVAASWRDRGDSYRPTMAMRWPFARRHKLSVVSDGYDAKTRMSDSVPGMSVMV